MTPLRPEDIPLLVPDPLIEAFLKDVDRTLLRAMLQCTATERVQNLEKMAQFSEEGRRWRETQNYHVRQALRQ